MPTPEEEIANEAKRLLELIKPNFKNLRPHEQTFVSSLQMTSKFGDLSITRKQLFWLRDIKDRYL